LVNAEEEITTQTGAVSAFNKRENEDSSVCF